MLIEKVGKGARAAQHNLVCTWAVCLPMVREVSLLACTHCSNACIWKACSCKELQQEADAAIDELGPPTRDALLNRAPLLAKMASLGSSGKFPANVERDLHRAMQRFAGINLVRLLCFERCCFA
jgi:hypothetical protein